MAIAAKVSGSIYVLATALLMSMAILMVLTNYSIALSRHISLKLIGRTSKILQSIGVLIFFVLSLTFLLSGYNLVEKIVGVAVIMDSQHRAKGSSQP
ncbi:hypothetical protein [Azospirillum baldaniorum]|uniref:hypothetical protein n=1 Tax=Azospirillum baldaniorum TaxID=1064539 RepID=UPI0011A74FD8|nr:hypothetical protein [Azospirillum baldaniorum]